MNDIKVIVLGCGPAGMLTAAAVRSVGYQPVILSLRKPSPIGGAQYLHRSIPGVTREEPDGDIEFIKQGTGRGYAMKVYDRSNASTSWDEFEEGPHPCWNLRQAYNHLWEMLGWRIVDMKITPIILARILDSGEYAAVMSTLPLRDFCMNPKHKFTMKEVFISLDADDLIPIDQRPRWAPPQEKNMIVWNGEPETFWYRQSSIYGFPGTEWPGHPHDRKVIRITKPLWTNCTCWPGLIKLGRYGRWKKGELVHHAYEGAIDALVGSHV